MQAAQQAAAAELARQAQPAAVELPPPAEAAVEPAALPEPAQPEPPENPGFELPTLASKEQVHTASGGTWFIGE